MEKILCPQCKGVSIKNGFQNNKQRYKCKFCNHRFQLEYTYNAYEPTTNTLIKNLLVEGCGVRSISRIIGISTTTVLSRMLKISKGIKIPYFNKLGCKFEVDELWSFIGNKDNFTWITYAIERETKHIIDFYVGRKTKETIRPLINKILLLQPTKIYTDRLNIYPSIIPKEIHKRFQYSTNKIERMNLTLRTHIKRLSRKTICFSKNKIYLEAHLRIYFWG
ncbi:IS1 family transposase [Winogradskyella haliclonae]|uniref:IS1 family transposase n=1 Tax=Winogradskyella haliclonae TaxID=2048558 RepID=A0ABQ2BZ00_9FLAO|nr:IS1 family transposase [Winogradskyella haliclonae]GGI57741.1 IS1 family transposase [Winogradskyella haliclonae]